MIPRNVEAFKQIIHKAVKLMIKTVIHLFGIDFISIQNFIHQFINIPKIFNCLSSIFSLPVPSFQYACDIHL